MLDEIQESINAPVKLTLLNVFNVMNVADIFSSEKGECIHCLGRKRINRINKSLEVENHDKINWFKLKPPTHARINTINIFEF